jgi:hypothetical protein
VVATTTTTSGFFSHGTFSVAFTVPAATRFTCYPVLAVGLTSQSYQTATYCVN